MDIIWHKDCFICRFVSRALWDRRRDLGDESSNHSNGMREHTHKRMAKEFRFKMVVWIEAYWQLVAGSAWLKYT